MKNKNNLILGAIVGVWLLVFIAMIFLKIKAAMFIMPIFTIALVFYLIYATVGTVKINNIGKNENVSKAENKTKKN